MDILTFITGAITSLVVLFVFQDPIILHVKRTKKQFQPASPYETSIINDPTISNGLLAFSLSQDVDFIESQRSIFPKHLHNEFDDCIGDMNLAVERLAVTIEGEEVFDPSQTDRAIRFFYTNYRGESGFRHAIILGTRWGRTSWHPTYGFLLRGFDLDKQEIREFALADCDFVTKG